MFVLGYKKLLSVVNYYCNPLQQKKILCTLLRCEIIFFRTIYRVRVFRDVYGPVKLEEHTIKTCT